MVGAFLEPSCGRRTQPVHSIPYSVAQPLERGSNNYYSIIQGGRGAAQKPPRLLKMNTEIIVAIVTGGLALVGVILSNHAATDRMNQAIKTAQAVTDAKLENLTREVREHNNFAQRMPVVEEQIKVINNRLKDLEREDAR